MLTQTLSPHACFCSFSGGTLEHPGLLKYSCDLRTNVRLLPPARVLLPHNIGSGSIGSDNGNSIDISSSSSSSSSNSSGGSSSRGGSINRSRQSGSSSDKSSRSNTKTSRDSSAFDESGELMHAVLGGRPLLTMAFDDMEVRVRVHGCACACACACACVCAWVCVWGG